MSPQLIEHIQDFFCRDDNSYVMPDKRYEGKRMLKRSYHHQLYNDYKTEFPLTKIGRTKFRKCKPKNVMYPTIRDRRSCLCSYCTNGGFYFSAARRADLTDKATLKFFVQTFICAEPTDACYHGQCEQCKNKITPEALANRSNKPYSRVNFKLWKLVQDGSFSHMKLVEQQESVLHFTRQLVPFIRKYLAHYNNMVKQYQATRRLKYEAEPGTMVVQLDFSQKYIKSTNAEIQSAFFGKAPISIFPIHARIRKLDGSWIMFSLVIVSDAAKQTHNEVKAYLNIFFEAIKDLHWFSEVTNVVYVSDGAASQFKTRYNMWNLTYHDLDYGLKAEWHFFATSHGKGPCDAIGAIFKRTADNLTNFDQITNVSTKIFASLVGEQLNKTKVIYVTDEYIAKVKNECEERQTSMVQTTPAQFQMLKSHFFQPTFCEYGQLNVSRHSCSCPNCTTSGPGVHCKEFRAQYRTCSLVARGKEIVHSVATPVVNPAVSDINDRQSSMYHVNTFVAAVYENEWYIGQVASVDEHGDYFVKFLKRVGENQNLFRQCSPAQQLTEQCTIQKENMLACVDPPAPSSNTRYDQIKLSPADYDKVCDLFQRFIECNIDGDDKCARNVLNSFF